MRTFKIDDNHEVVCVAENTRSGFRHLATLMYKGHEVDKAKCTYINRTWESYQFESVLSHLLHKTDKLSYAEKAKFEEVIKQH